MLPAAPPVYVTLGFVTVMSVIITSALLGDGTANSKTPSANAMIDTRAPVFRCIWHPSVVRAATW